MKQTFITLSCAALALLASACTNTDLPNEATDNNTDNTPVALSIALTGDATVSRTRSIATDIASKYLATGEVTMDSEVRAGIFLPALRGYIPFDGTMESGHYYQAGVLISGNKLSKLTLVNPEPTSTPNSPLYMKHLDLAAPKTAGLSVVPDDNLFNTLSGNTTRTDGTAPTYSFELKHDHTKVSVLLVDPAGKPIEDAAEVFVGQLPVLKDYVQQYGSAIVEKEGFVTSKFVYQEDDVTGRYDFASPANASSANHQDGAPAHLWNTTMPISHNNGDEHTSIEAKNGETSTPLPNGIDLSAAQLNIAFAAYTDANGAAMPPRTYKLALGDIILTNLPASDPRLTAGANGKGTLKHTLSSEHLVLTVVIDKDALISATASATVGKWHIAKASTASGGDANTDSGQIKE